MTRILSSRAVIRNRRKQEVHGLIEKHHHQTQGRSVVLPTTVDFIRRIQPTLFEEAPTRFPTTGDLLPESAKRPYTRDDKPPGEYYFNGVHYHVPPVGSPVRLNMAPMPPPARMANGFDVAFAQAFTRARNAAIVRDAVQSAPVLQDPRNIHAPASSTVSASIALPADMAPPGAPEPPAAPQAPVTPPHPAFLPPEPYLIPYIPHGFHNLRHEVEHTSRGSTITRLYAQMQAYNAASYQQLAHDENDSDGDASERILSDLEDEQADLNPAHLEPLRRRRHGVARRARRELRRYRVDRTTQRGEFEGVMMWVGRCREAGGNGSRWRQWSEERRRGSDHGLSG
jgi:hypothetical protein